MTKWVRCPLGGMGDDDKLFPQGWRGFLRLGAKGEILSAVALERRSSFISTTQAPVHALQSGKGTLNSCISPIYSFNRNI